MCEQCAGAPDSQQKASSAATFLLLVTLAARGGKRKREGTSGGAAFGFVGSKQTAHLHFMSASRISPQIVQYERVHCMPGCISLYHADVEASFHSFSQAYNELFSLFVSEKRREARKKSETYVFIHVLLTLFLTLSHYNENSLNKIVR